MDLHPEHSSASALNLVMEDKGISVPPSSLPEEHLQPDPPAFPQGDLVSVSKEDAQQAFIQHAAERCCRSQRPAEQCVITNMESFNTHRYRLETFTETRTSQTVVMPCYSEHIFNDGTPPPEIWEMEVHAPPFFQDWNQTINIPNTEEKKACINCSATGESHCYFCYGNGRSLCGSCGGSGSFYMSGNRNICLVCGGIGWNRFGL
ncbi:protein SSUH2 homolog [Halichoeres trimaculatus]|uniref:protein SSUH2 homolog n=1 Tax=Halichoeres trimaculatus TaxID=147232 RepID=UPI003D9E39AA